MSALKQNPFLVGFGAVMLVGVGALGYLAYSASEDSAAASSKYSEAEAELKRLQNLPVSASESVLKKVTEQKDDITAKRDSLRKELAAIKIKEEPITGPAFQDRLKVAVAQLGAKSTEANLSLPGGKDKIPFYLGFNQYQSEPAKDVAAPHLFKQLRAIEVITNILASYKNVKLEEVLRPELPEEKTSKPAAPDPKDKNAKAKDAEANSVVKRSNVTVRFEASHENFQKILNDIISNKQQLFVVRRLSIENERKDAPQRSLVGNVPPPPPIDPGVPAAPAPTPADPAAPAPATPATPPAAPADPAAPAAAVPPPTAPANTPPPTAPAPVDAAASVAAPAPAVTTIFGSEQVKVKMEIEIVDVADPETPDKDKPTAQKKEK